MSSQYKKYLTNLNHKPNNLGKEYEEKLGRAIDEKQKEKKELQANLQWELYYLDKKLESSKTSSDKLKKVKEGLIHDLNVANNIIEKTGLAISNNNEKSTNLKCDIENKEKEVLSLNTAIENYKISNSNLRMRLSDTLEGVATKRKINLGLIITIILIVGGLIIYGYSVQENINDDKDYKSALWESENNDDYRRLNIYIDKYPKGNHITKAKKIVGDEKIYSSAMTSYKENNNYELLEKYVSRYPKGKYVSKAKLIIKEEKYYSIAIAKIYPDNNYKFIEAYIGKYPNGKYYNEAKAIVKEKINYSNAIIKYDKDGNYKFLISYIEKYPNGDFVNNHISQAKAIVKEEEDYSLANKYFQDYNDSRLLEEYIEKYPKGRHVDNIKNIVKKKNYNIIYKNEYSELFAVNDDYLFSLRIKSISSNLNLILYQVESYNHIMGRLKELKVYNIKKGSFITLKSFEGGFIERAEFSSDNSIIYFINLQKKDKKYISEIYKINILSILNEKIAQGLDFRMVTCGGYKDYILVLDLIKQEKTPTYYFKIIDSLGRIVEEKEINSILNKEQIIMNLLSELENPVYGY